MCLTIDSRDKDTEAVDIFDEATAGILHPGMASVSETRHRTTGQQSTKHKEALPRGFGSEEELKSVAEKRRRDEGAEETKLKLIR